MIGARGATWAGETLTGLPGPVSGRGGRVMDRSSVPRRQAADIRPGSGAGGADAYPVEVTSLPQRPPVLHL